MFPSDPNDVPKKRPVPADPRRQIAISEPPASKNIGQDDGAQQNQHYISQLREKLLDDFEKTYRKLLDDFEKKFLQRSNSSDPTACLEECRITCVTALVLKGVPQHVKEHYEWSLMPGKPSRFKKLKNVPLTGLTPQSEDQSITEGCTHTPEENSVHTTNDAKEATSKGSPLPLSPFIFNLIADEFTSMLLKVVDILQLLHTRATDPRFPHLPPTSWSICLVSRFLRAMEALWISAFPDGGLLLHFFRCSFETV